MTPLPTDPTVLPRRQRALRGVRGLRSRLGLAKRRAAVATSAALLAAGGLAMNTGEPTVLDAPTVAVVEAPVEVQEPAPRTLLPPPIVRVSDADRGGAADDERGEPIEGGRASYYGAELAGNRTANGERFDPTGHTAAHRTLPFGTRVRVTNEANGNEVVVRVNDRGPFAKDRVIDVSTAAAREIGMIRSGTATVSLERLPDGPADDETRGVRG